MFINPDAFGLLYGRRVISRQSRRNVTLITKVLQVPLLSVRTTRAHVCRDNS
jgi:hypothetical protein